jgi:hypothetical protein
MHLCICDMDSVVSCAYWSAYVFVFLAHTSHIYQSISVMYMLKIHTYMHGRFTDVDSPNGVGTKQFVLSCP